MSLVDSSQLKTLLGPLAGRFDVDTLDVCDSTNSELLRRVDRGCPSGMVVVADQQTSGRGRRGRHWLSAPEASLTFSVLWRFSRPEQLGGLSLAVGVAIAEALSDLGAHAVRLKWPNDVLLARGESFAKLAGILIELTGDRKGMQAVIGIGINLAPPQGELAYPIAGLSEALSPLPDHNVVLAAILSHLALTLDAFTVDGFFGQKQKWQALHAWQGRRVQVLDEGSQAVAGQCLGADDDGSLLIVTDQGAVERIVAGDVSLRPL